MTTSTGTTLVTTTTAPTDPLPQHVHDAECEPSEVLLGAIDLQQKSPTDEPSYCQIPVTEDSAIKIEVIEKTDQIAGPESHIPIPFVDEDINDLSNATEAWWATGDHVIPSSLLDEVDESIKELLPPGTEVVGISPHGNSQWSRTAEIQTELEGNSVSYFLKVTDRPSGQAMYHCEFESLVVMYEAVPEYCPRPIGWGQYETDPNVWFLLTSFIEMYDDDLDPEFLPKALAELHRKALSPDGKHGSRLIISSGALPVKLAQSDSWEDFFFRYVRYMLRAEEIAAGPRTAEMEQLLDALFNRIIPRLLRPLETGGRTIIPVFLHTDLWAGNTGTNTEGLPIIFDPCSMYGHNEFDLGVWSAVRGMITRPFIDNYTNLNERSQPMEDFNARNLLYLL
ncbi:Fructosamine kinase-domain-containing protein [Stachybotrys elegans]|uniref:protein-ribulosamine 3-kinase n=1 Tax=Stachybotrys elegans TaxID=80388 RepID=A0A8K0SE45_9HYPO|nr:Fructosamine kinase-domain-containing protein [Stachybotrys elegans]